MKASLKTAVKKLLPPQIWRLLKLAACPLRPQPPDFPELAEWERKIREIGTVTAGSIIAEGLTLKNCYKQFPLVVVENLYHQQYRVHLSGRWIAIDIGANAGVAALFLAQNPNICRVYAFEPVRPIFAMLQENLLLNPKAAAKIEPFNFGLAAHTGTASVAYSEDHAMSASTGGIYDSYFKTITSQEVVSLKDAAPEVNGILNRHQHERALLKLDCEGAEFDIMPRLASEGCLDRVDLIMCEFHNRSPIELNRLLEVHGFTSFTEWLRRDLDIGMIRAVRTR